MPEITEGRITLVVHLGHVLTNHVQSDTVRSIVLGVEA